MTLKERITRQGPSAVLILLTIGFIATSYQYRETSRELPLLVAWTTLLLLTVEFITQGGSRLGSIFRMYLVGKASNLPGFDKRPTASVSQELGAFAWVFAVLAAVTLFGFYITIPLYVASFLRIRAQTSFKTAIVCAVVLTGIIYLLFEVLMEYRLFHGLVFGDY